MTHDHLQNLLTHADRQFQAADISAAPISRPISIPDLQKRLAHRRARRVTTVATTIACVALVVVGLGRWNGHSAKPDSKKLATGPARASLSEPRSLPVETSMDERALVRLEREAAIALREAKALQHELQRDSLRKQYVALLRRSPLAEPRSTLERAAQFRLALATELGRQFGNSGDIAMREYQEIVKEFPHTTSAVSAEQRLADARSES